MSLYISQIYVCDKTVPKKGKNRRIWGYVGRGTKKGPKGVDKDILLQLPSKVPSSLINFSLYSPSLLSLPLSFWSLSLSLSHCFKFARLVGLCTFINLLWESRAEEGRKRTPDFLLLTKYRVFKIILTFAISTQIDKGVYRILYLDSLSKIIQSIIKRIRFLYWTNHLSTFENITFNFSFTFLFEQGDYVIWL